MKILLLFGLLQASVRPDRMVAHGWNPSRDIDRAARLAGLSQPVRDKLSQAATKLDVVGDATGGNSPVFFSAASSLQLDYGIFRGRSALRPDKKDRARSRQLTNVQEDLHRLQDRYVTRDASFARRIGRDDDEGAAANDDDELELLQLQLHLDLPKACLSLMLLLEGRGDAAHEAVLGVTADNFREAEYAASHPPSNWSRLHPLSDEDDMVHSLVHRWEGEHVGEGNHTGWENAKYWACGGPKRLDGDELGAHPVRRALALCAAERAPNLVRLGVVAPARGEHRILADGGSHRSVVVPPGCWDPIQFIDLKRRISLPVLDECHAIAVDDCRREVCELEALEIALLIRCSLLAAPSGGAVEP
jgi:hypothetical protein